MSQNLTVLITRGHGSNQKCTEISAIEINGVHWDNVSGGVKSRTSGYSLYGYVPYSFVAKYLNCSGEHDFGTNSAKVLIHKATKTSPYYEGYLYLLEMAGEKPASLISLHRPKGAPPCTKKLLELLKERPYTRKELREKLLDLGYTPKTISSAMKTVVAKQWVITSGGSNNSTKQLLTLKDI